MFKAILFSLVLIPLTFATAPAKADTATLSPVALESTANFLAGITHPVVDDHHCHRRCEHHYNNCVDHCRRMGHHGCRKSCEPSYHHCKRHCH